MKRFVLVLLLAVTALMLPCATSQTIPIPEATPTCDPLNPNHIGADEMKALGRKASAANQVSELNCLFYIGVTLGLPKVEAAYAYFLYYGEQGMPQDVQAAFALNEKAGNEGMPTAEEFLALQYYAGIGVKADIEKSEYWYKKAIQDPAIAADIKLRAEKESPVWSGLGAKHTVSQSTPGPIPMYTQTCDPRNALNVSGSEAISRAEKAGKAGDGSSMLCWDYVACTQGNSRGEAEWGYALLTGKGVDEDDEEAFKWTKRAADQGSPIGEQNLSKMYEEGWGTPVDSAKAEYWATKASSDPDARKAQAADRQMKEGVGIVNSIIDADKKHQECEDNRDPNVRTDPCHY